MNRNNLKGNYTKEWYALLRKPFFAPPSWIFAPVWTALYLIIAISFGYVFYQTYRSALPLLIAAPFLCNLITNFAYTPIQFRLRNLVLASLDILLVLFSLVELILFIRPYYSWVAWVNLPYLLWVSFATMLQLTITFMNREKWTASRRNP